MQAIAIRSELSAALALACKVVQRKNTLPILTNLALVEERGALTVKANDLDRDLSIRLPESPVDSGFATTLPAHALKDAEKKAPDSDEIEVIAEDENDAMPGATSLRFGKLSLRMQSLPFSDYPDLAFAGPVHADFTMPREALARMLDKVAFAVSTEETRYYLNGIFMHFKRSERGAPVSVRFVATDGHRLAQHDVVQDYRWSKRVAPAGFRGVILPAATCKTLAELCKTKGIGDVFRIEVNTVKVRFTVGNVTLVSKLIDGTFPDYQRVIPVRNPHAFTVDNEGLIEAVKGVAAVASAKGSAVKLTLQPGAMIASVRDVYTGEASQTAPCDWTGPEGFEVGANHGYVLDMLARIDAKHVTFMLDDSGSPMLIRDGASSFVLMPMRV